MALVVCVKFIFVAALRYDLGSFPYMLQYNIQCTDLHSLLRQVYIYLTKPQEQNV